MCCWSPSQRRIWRQNYGSILLCLSIIDDYHYGSTLIVFVMMIELYPFWLIYSCIYWILHLCLCRSLHVQVSVHGDRGDRDQPEQRNGSIDSSTSTSVGIQVGPHHWSLIAIRNLRVSVVWLLLDPIWASRDRLCPQRGFTSTTIWRLHWGSS